ncbi:hypothetical protein D3C81_1295130 [compost metagenome]
MKRVPIMPRSQPSVLAAHSAAPSDMPPDSTMGPSNIRRTARTKAKGLAQPVCPPAPAVSRIRPSAPAASAFSAWRIEATSANTRQPISCSGWMTASGEPTLAMTISTRWRMRTCRSSSSVARRRMMMFGQTGATGPGASAQRALIWVSQASSCSAPRALIVGNAPMTPLRHAAATRPGPDTRSIGAAISGSRRRDASDEGKLMQSSRQLLGHSLTVRCAKPYMSISSHTRSVRSSRQSACAPPAHRAWSSPGRNRPPPSRRRFAPCRPDTLWT